MMMTSNTTTISICNNNKSYSYVVASSLFLLLLLLLFSSVVEADPISSTEASIDPLGIISIQRGMMMSNNNNANNALNIGSGLVCNFVGTITLGGPFSLSSEDKFYNIGNKQLTSYGLIVDYVNRHRCGVNILGKQYSLSLHSYDDQSSKEWTTIIANYLVGSSGGSNNNNKNDTTMTTTTNDVAASGGDGNGVVDVLLGGYSSGLTVHLADAANTSQRLLLAPGAASTGVFKDRPMAFGTFPPTAKYTAQAIKALAEVAGAKSIASFWEDASFTRGVCGAIPDLASQYGLELTSHQQVEKDPNVTILTDLATNISQEDPDIVMTCVYDEGCQNWMAAMQEVNWSPRAQVFTVCVGLQSFVDAVGDDAQYIMGVTPWDQSLNIVDKVTGWSASQFATEFMMATGDVDVTYHAASAASVISIAIQAIEESNTLDETLLSQHIAQSTFPTIYGNVNFDTNGQSLAPSLLVQYDANGTVQTIFPPETSSGPILYPMPTWDKRQCQRHSTCTDAGNTCNDEGLCICSNPDDEYAVGSGTSAMCIPKEDMNFIMPALKSLVYLLVAMTLSFALVCLCWVYYYRNNLLVKVAQPTCLCLIVVGCIISTSSIIPMGYETGYRDEDDIHRADAACMAIPWLWGLGFSICFSSLFAKVWRVKQLFQSATGFRRQQVGMKSVLTIMAGMIFAEVTILTTFQIVSPQIWERVVIDDINGYAIESEGHCYSDYGWWFWLALVIFNVLSLFYALVLCFKTKGIPSDFAESSHIFLSVMFMFQVLVLAVPVSAMVKDDPDVFYFIRALAVWLQNSTVLIIIFGPKMLRIYKGEDTNATVKKSIAAGVSKHSSAPPQSFSEHNYGGGSCGNSNKDASNKSINDMWKESYADCQVVGKLSGYESSSGKAGNVSFVEDHNNTGSINSVLDMPTRITTGTEGGSSLTFLPMEDIVDEEQAPIGLPIDDKEEQDSRNGQAASNQQDTGHQGEERNKIELPTKEKDKECDAQIGDASGNTNTEGGEKEAPQEEKSEVTRKGRDEHNDWPTGTLNKKLHNRPSTQTKVDWTGEIHISKTPEELKTDY